MKDLLHLLAEAGEPEDLRGALVPGEPSAFLEFGATRREGSPRGSRNVTIAHHEILPARDARFARPQEPLPPPLESALRDLGVPSLYLHQARALDAARRGENVVLATPTASGKTLVYLLPVVERILSDPDARALCLFPLKALEQDQLRGARALAARLAAHAGGPEVTAAIYDGDTSSHRRKKIRERPPGILITNPDMLHLGILAFHARWERFFRDLRFIVVDELHTYRGVFGSHMAHVLRRVLRVARFYGAVPRVIACSATIDNPGELAADLTGLPFTVIDEDGSPGAERHFVFVNPVGSPYTAAARLFRRAVRAGYKTIAFTKARKITELIHAWTLASDPALGARISAYRGGYLPEERREIEGRLKSGDLWGVISTSALEMGIDIGELDVCILVGYPGSIVNTWQRAGRVGRAGRSCAIVLVAQPDALDQYFVHHPSDFFRRGYERAVVDPGNLEIMAPHLVCAAAEVPLRREGDLYDLDALSPAIARLEEEGRLLRSAAGTEWFAGPSRPHRGLDIRGLGEGFTILDEDTQARIGSVSMPRALAECHGGAIYLHRARQYHVTRLDLEKRDVHARAVDVPWYTRSLGEKETEILSLDESLPPGRFVAHRGRLRVTSRITAFEKRMIQGQALLSTHPLDLPPTTFETVGAWVEIDDPIRHRMEEEGFHFMGSIHAMEHAAISLFPLFALCDRDDVGGISRPDHPQVGRSAVFFYDGHPGGVGLCNAVFPMLDRMLAATRDLIGACPCERGCPSCVHSPKCGNGNRPIDKAGAARVIDYLLVRAALPARPAPRPSLRLPLVVNPVPEATPAAAPAPRRVLVLDLETQRSAEEVGGWHNAHLMRLAVAVVYDALEDRFESYTEKEVHELLRRLGEGELVVGYNLLRFDYPVLRGYTGEDLAALPTFDLLADLHAKLGFRISLGHLAEHTLGAAKTGDGLDSLRWWREGRVQKVIDYCRRDVDITRRLFEHGARERHVIFEKRGGHRVRLPVAWDVEAILARRAPEARA